MSAANALLNSCSQRLFKFRTLTALLQLTLAALLLHTNVAQVAATSAPTMGANLEPESMAAGKQMLGYDEAKRSWQSLHGAWGKRAPSSDGWGADAWTSDSAADADADAVVLTENWMPLMLSSGGAGGIERESEQPLRYTVVLSSAAAFDRLAHQQRHAAEDEAAAAAAARFNDGDLSNLSQEELDAEEARNILNEKRTWKSMNVAWGKRRNAPEWNKFRGAWGKREPGWNNLKGMWGKRSSKDWQKLHAGWGKRSDMN